MSYLDSPICRCELMRVMVLTDQTQTQCAEEHCCPAGQICPLKKLFEESGATAQIPVSATGKKPRAKRG